MTAADQAFVRKEGKDTTGAARFITIIEMVYLRRVKVNGLFNEVHSQDARVEIDVLLGVAGEGGDMVDTFYHFTLFLQKNNKMGISDKLFQMKNEKAAANLKAGEDFLAANKEKPGVVALPSGLQYEVITEGTGVKPLASNKVTCHYHGTLIDGTVFDSSVKRGQPATFPLNAVIKGWTEGLQLMATGSKFRFFIPPHLGYGDRQVSAQIGPNSTLVFEVELLGVS